MFIPEAFKLNDASHIFDFEGLCAHREDPSVRQRFITMHQYQVIWWKFRNEAMYKTTEALSLHRLNRSLHAFANASVTDNDAKNPDIDTKKEKGGQEETRDKCRQAEELEVVSL
jgi:hypothetical protein